MISLDKGFQATERKEFVTDAVVANPEDRDPLKNPQSEKEVCSAYAFDSYITFSVVSGCFPRIAQG